MCIFKVYSIDVNSETPHLVSMSLLNSELSILNKTLFESEGGINDFLIPSDDSYAICFDGR